MKSIVIWPAFMVIVCLVFMSVFAFPRIAISALLSVVAIAAFFTAFFGFVVTAMHDPLPKIGEKSIFGKRFSSFRTVSIRTVYLLTSSVYAWTIAKRLELAPAGLDTPGLVLRLMGEASQIIILLAFFWWMVLPVDLLRLRKSGRARGIEKLAVQVKEFADSRVDPLISRGLVWTVLKVGKLSLESRIWILLAFYLVPVFLLIGVNYVDNHYVDF